MWGLWEWRAEIGVWEFGVEFEDRSRVGDREGSLGSGSWKGRGCGW